MYGTSDRASSSTIGALIAGARERLSSAGIPADESALDARLLAQHVLDWDAARLIANGSESTPTGFVERYAELVRRRIAREPLAYITGVREFWNLTLEVSPAVLVPRPETECLVEAALERLPNERTSTRLADVGTGSGCVAIAVAYERPHLQVVATDISPDALVVARRNAQRFGTHVRTAFLQTNLLDGIPGSFDVIVSNPPYVPMDTRASLQPEVREFEPSTALFGGPDGMDAIRALVEQSPVHLAPGGFLLFEMGAGQDSAVRELISASRTLTMVELKRDLQGIPRVAVAVKTRRALQK
jgi:release factor glutamine methyltransferase